MKAYLYSLLFTLTFLISCNNQTKLKQNEMQLDFPIKSTTSLNEKIKNEYWRCNDNSHVDSALRYYLIIPNNVKPTNLKEENIPGRDNLKQIASYRRIDDAPYLEIQVVYERLEHEINPSDWQENLLDFSDETIIDQRKIKGNAGTYLDALTKKTVRNGNVVISRTLAKKNFDAGNKRCNIVCVKVSCDAKDYPNLAEEMMAITTEWDFINKSDYQLSEDVSLLHMKSDNLAFYFPNSWKPSRLIVKKGMPERYVLFNKVEENISLGAINIFISNQYDSEIQIFKEVIERFKNKGVTLELEDLQHHKVSNSKDNQFTEEWRTLGTLSESDSLKNDITIVIRKLKDKFILFECVGVSKTSNQYNWARNKRALELALQTLQPYKAKPVTS